MKREERARRMMEAMKEGVRRRYPGAQIDIETQPQFKPGDRFFTHYDMKWGEVVELRNTERDRTHGVTGNPLPDTTWYEVRYDDGSTALLDDAHGDWEMARIVPPAIAERHGYGSDPKAV